MPTFDPVWLESIGDELLALLKKAEVPEYALPECGSKILSEIQRWSGNRNVNHFSHEYLIAIRRLPIDWGGGYMACVPQLGTGAFNGSGDTPEEALNNLQELYVYLQEVWKDDPAWEWPEPKDEDCIAWQDVKQLSADEVSDKFKAYLAEANKRLLTGQEHE